MLGLADIRTWLSSLDIIPATWTIGRYEAEKEKRACVYQRQSYGEPTVALGGAEATKTLFKSVQVLIHWNKNHRETEEAALALYRALQFNPRPTIAGHRVTYLDLRLPEPVDLGSDTNGIFERAVWLDIYFEEE